MNMCLYFLIFSVQIHAADQFIQQCCVKSQNKAAKKKDLVATFKMVLKDQVGKARCKIMRIICLVAKASLPSNANISLRPDCNSDFSFS